MDTVRIGSGGAFAADRILPARVLVEDEQVDYLCIDTLAEITATAAGKRLSEGGVGHVPLLEDRLRALLEPAAKAGTTIVTNAGAADPVAGAELADAIASEADIDIDVVAITGDDCGELVRDRERFDLDPDAVFSANAYIGAEAVVGALEHASGTGDATVVIGGRIADPSMYVGALAYEFGWPLDDWALLGRATVIGHLLECNTLVTGGYFAEPGRKPVEGAHELGSPYADVDADGGAVLTKPDHKGGRVDRHTVAEQLCYEVHDPAAYLTPDVSADFTGVSLEETGPDEVTVSGGDGSARPEMLKVLVGLDGGYKFEAAQAYGGPNAEARARYTGDVVERRLRAIHGYDESTLELRIDVVGVDALYHGAGPDLYRAADHEEVQLRIAGRSPAYEPVRTAWREARAMPTFGAAAGSGTKPDTSTPDDGISETIAVESVFVPREEIVPRYHQMGEPEGRA